MVIDLHGHCTPLVYVEALLARDAYPRARSDGDGYRVEVADGVSYRAGPLHWDLAARMPMLNAAGITHQALSLSAPYGFELLAGSEAVAVAEAVNQVVLESVRPCGDRFLPLASVPVEESGEGIGVLRRALRAGHRGMILSASVVVELPDDGLLAPYLEEIEAAGGWVLVHPGARVDTRGLPRLPYALNVAGFQNELTVALFRLVWGGLLDRVPSLPAVFVNLGGAAPLLAERMRSMAEGRQDATPWHAGFRRVYYDYSSFHEHSLEAAVAVLGADRLVLGTDFPIQGLERPLRVLERARLDEDTREAIRQCNAVSFLRGPAQVPHERQPRAGQGEDGSA